MAPLDFGRIVNPISARGAFYAHHITTGVAGFSDLPTDLWNGASQLLSSKNGGTSSKDTARTLVKYSSQRQQKYICLG